MKKIVLTGGGTAGHVTPHLAILPTLREEGYEIHYIGSIDGIEKSIIEKEGDITYHPIHTGKLRRYFDVKNFTDIFNVLLGIRESKKLIRELKPDVCFSKGGFVSVPVAVACGRYRVPLLCHESDLTPGLATKIDSRFAKKIATTFPECAKELGEKAVCTGSPLRRQLYNGDRAEGLRLAGLSGERPVLLMTGGSLGAQSVNQALRGCLEDLLREMDVIHLTGKGNLDESLTGLKGYKQFDFVNEEMPHLLAAADLVLSRAGSNTLCELHALKKPMLLVPYPMGASRGDQILNAASYEKRGLAMVLPQDKMTPETLKDAIFALREKAPALRAALEAAPAADGREAVCRLIEEVQA